MSQSTQTHFESWVGSLEQRCWSCLQCSSSEQSFTLVSGFTACSDACCIRTCFVEVVGDLDCRCYVGDSDEPRYHTIDYSLLWSSISKIKYSGMVFSRQDFLYAILELQESSQMMIN